MYGTSAGDSSMFQYKSRVRGNILRLLQPTYISKDELSFNVVELPRGSATNYNAVSYTWGSGDPTESILLDGKHFAVRPNLWSCLYYLGKAQRSEGWSYLWVDAICINQMDNTEKSEQVSSMDATYRNASRVSVWLGLAGLPRDFVPLGQAAGPAPNKIFDVEDLDWADLVDDLANRPYWNRCWVVQEFLLASDVFLHCSNATMEWQDFKDIVADHEGFDAVGPPFGRAARRKRPARTESAATPLLLARHEDKYPEFSQPLQELLLERRMAQCCDLRDRVFSLLGLVTDEEQEFLRRCLPDYSLSHEHVVILALAHMAEFHKGLLPTSADVVLDQITAGSNHMFEALGLPDTTRRQRQALLDYARNSPYFDGESGECIRRWLHENSKVLSREL
ncbi:HET domain-containing protein [Microdochium nivale]|nr:HET domain-containing protein [Microdochium nivale]